MKSGITVLGIISILCVVVFASGCTTTESPLFTYNFSSANDTNYVGAQNITVPNGTKTIKIQGENLTSLNSGLDTSYVNIYLLSTIPTTVVVNGNQTDFIAQYNKSIVVLKTINLVNESSPLSVNYTFNDTNIKGILIVNANANGIVQVFTT